MAKFGKKKCKIKKTEAKKLFFCSPTRKLGLGGLDMRDMVVGQPSRPRC